MCEGEQSCQGITGMLQGYDTFAMLGIQVHDVGNHSGLVMVLEGLGVYQQTPMSLNKETSGLHEMVFGAYAAHAHIFFDVNSARYVPGPPKLPKIWTLCCLYSLFWDIRTSFWALLEVQVATLGPIHRGVNMENHLQSLGMRAGKGAGLPPLS